jgi:hypothetical protein
MAFCRVTAQLPVNIASKYSSLTFVIIATCFGSRTITGHYYTDIIKTVSTFATCINNKNAYKMRTAVNDNRSVATGPKWQDHPRRVRHGKARTRLGVTYCYVHCLSCWLDKQIIRLLWQLPLGCCDNCHSVVVTTATRLLWQLSLCRPTADILSILTKYCDWPPPYEALDIRLVMQFKQGLLEVLIAEWVNGQVGKWRQVYWK